ncbi:hypothetical protein [Hyphomonas sp.]|uniref:hypothetical protein n=1 Tax=Hyphomonas sp. TaxID=87 RepID=UPI0030F95535
MYLSGPSNAKVGQKITITANGAPSGTEQIKFTAEGNIGFDTVETTSGSASFQLDLDFAGTTRITAQAHDKFANALDSASHSVTVVDPAFEAAGGGLDRVGGWFMGPDTASVGETIQLTASGLGQSVVAEFSAQGLDLSSTRVHVSGGSASTSARAYTEGSASVSARGYNENGQCVEEVTHTVQIRNKNRGSAPSAALGPMPQISAPPAAAGTPWRMQLQNLAEAHSVIVEFFGANGGIYRLFPRQRNQMDLTLTFENSGSTQVCVSLRNQSLSAIQVASTEVNVADPAVQPTTQASPLTVYPAGTVPVLGATKPPFAALAGHHGPAIAPAASGTGDLTQLINAKTASLMSRLNKS